MTPAALAQTLALPWRIDYDALVEQALRFNRVLRPYDGWLAAGLLTLNLMVVVWSVESANWVPTPSLAFVMLLAALCGFVVSRLPIWGLVALPLGLVVGMLVVVWQLVSFQHEDVALANSAELLERLGLWAQAAHDGAINIDPIPFAFALLALTWLVGLLGAWMFVRHRHFWGVFILGGAGLLSNLTYLPPNTNVLLWIYLFTALILVARVQSVRRRKRWEERNLVYDGHLGILSFADSSLVAAVVLMLAFFAIPKGDQWGPANSIYEGLRAPMATWEEDFNRLFAGLPARRAMGYRIWGDTMPFHGTINPTTVPVLQVQSPMPMYLKGRSYDTYTSKGWMTKDTRLEGLYWKPSFSHSAAYQEITEVEYVVNPNYSSRTLFSSGRVTGSSLAIEIETYDSPVYILNIAGAVGASNLPPLLQRAAQDVSNILAETGGRATDFAIAGKLPGEFSLLEVRRENGLAQELVLAEKIAADPDVLSVRSSKGKNDSGDPYLVTSQVSVAKPELLRTAGTDYPTWALVKYTQLPSSLPPRVRELSAILTEEEDNPYDKAKAVETFLRGMTYNLEIDPPPFGADGVDYFLFESKEGYSEYFGSAMAVMLRSVGIPARMISGYSTGDKVPDEDIYIVRDSHSHGWVEVFFPNYGWIPFEPTPGRALPINYVQDPSDTPVVVVDSSGEEPLILCEEDFEECEEEEFPAEAAEFPVDSGVTQGLRQAAPWLLSLLGIAAIIAAGARFFWMKVMEPSRNPETLFRRLGLLGRLNSLGPKPHETPYQFGNRLGEALPELEGSCSLVVDRYVEWKYGKKDLSREQTDGMIQAWLSLRKPLLLRIFRPRNPQRAVT